MNVFDKIDYPVRDPNLITDVVGGFHDVTSPLVSSATISEDGTETTIVFNESVLMVGYDSGDFSLDCSTTDTALADPSGSGTTWVFSNVETIGAGETCTLDYTGSAGEITDLAGNSLAGFTDAAVTNLNEGAAACATADVNPSNDTLAGSNWTFQSGTSFYTMLSDWSDATYVYGYDNNATPFTVRFTLPGDCDVTDIAVVLRINNSTSGVLLAVKISNDNTNWTSTQEYTNAGGAAGNISHTYSSLSWTTPTYVYVNVAMNSLVYNVMNIWDMKVTLNP